MSEESKSGACASCDKSGCTASQKMPGETDEQFMARQQRLSRMCRIENKILVMSGKGGVGKSTVAVNLATELMLSGKKVGLLDIDIHGPSVPTLLGIEDQKLMVEGEDLVPFELGDMKVMSIGFMLRERDDAIIWRGPRKAGVIGQFIGQTVWGDLDYLIIDSPPGTGDELLAISQMMDRVDGAVVVTTPQKVAAIDVRKSINFCRHLQVEVLGVVENMSGYCCPKCGEVTQILPAGAGRAIASDMDVPFWGSVPMDPLIAQSCDAGEVFVHRQAKSPTAEIMRGFAQRLIENCEKKKLATTPE